MMGWGAGTSWMLGGSIIMILFWVLIIVGIVFLVRWIAGDGRSSAGREETPLEILKKRYARGEITKAQYEEMKKAIM
jgi:putative membrane protein